tara:strand:+ start:5252 stop:5803 length:552 start_codon:yes stop_codon:yes gene_type:complete
MSEERYCRLCKKKETKNKCAYGPSMWEKYTVKDASDNERKDAAEESGIVSEGKKKGLWDRVWAKRKRGEKPAKPGDEDYPKTLNVENKTFKQFMNEKSADWQKVNKKDKTDGMGDAAIKAYRRDNPGSKLKGAVTGDPKPGSKDANRRKNYCDRSAGQQKMHNIDCSKTPDKPICKARRRWKC